MRVNWSDDIVPGYQLSAPIHPPQRSRAYSPISAPADCAFGHSRQTKTLSSLCSCSAVDTLMRIMCLRFLDCSKRKLGIDSGSSRVLGFTCQPEHRLCWTWVEQYYLKIHQNGLGLKSEVS